MLRNKDIRFLPLQVLLNTSHDQGSVRYDAFGGRSVYTVPAEDAGENYKPHKFRRVFCVCL